jgi:hypothetical protein
MQVKTPALMKAVAENMRPTEASRVGGTAVKLAASVNNRTVEEPRKVGSKVAGAAAIVYLFYNVATALKEINLRRYA